MKVEGNNSVAIGGIGGGLAEKVVIGEMLKLRVIMFLLWEMKAEKQDKPIEVDEAAEVCLRFWSPKQKTFRWYSTYVWD